MLVLAKGPASKLMTMGESQRESPISGEGIHESYTITPFHIGWLV